MSRPTPEPAPDDPQLSAGERILLERILRGRPADDSAARRLAPDGVDPEPAITRLIDLGYLARHADGLNVAPPENAILDRVVRMLHAQIQQLDEAISVMEQVPALVQAWHAGVAGRATLRGEHVAGRSAVLRHWFDLSTRSVPREPRFAYPNGVVLRRLVTPHLPALAERYADRSFPGRFLIADGALDDPDVRRVLEAFASFGARVRVRADVPAWAYVERGVAASLAAADGSEIPDAATTVYDAEVVALVGALFDEWWADARPLGTGDEPWRPVLRQLAEGRSDEQAAAALGLSLRTVRRRISEAMVALDVRSRFELGAAWAALDRD